MAKWCIVYSLIATIGWIATYMALSLKIENLKEDVVQCDFQLEKCGKVPHR